MTVADRGATTGVGPELLAELVERAADAVVVADSSGRIVWVNAQVGTLLGWEADDLVGRPVEALVPPALKGRHRAHREAFALNPRPRTMAPELTLTAMRADGAEIPVEISLTPMGDGLVAAVIRDVSHRRAVEKALQDSKNQLRTSLDRMLDGFAVFTSVRDNGEIVDFTFDYVNDEGARTYSLEVDDLIGRRMTEIVPAIKTSGVFERYAAVVESGVAWVPEPVVYDDTGASGIFELRAWKLEDGFAVTWRDVSEAVQAAVRLREGEERFRQVTSSLPDALSLFSAIRDETGAIVDFRWDYANDAASVLTGYSGSELLNRTLLEVFPEQVSGDIIQTYRHVVETGEMYADPARWHEHVWGDGRRQRKCFDIRATKVGDGFLVVTRDVTAERERDEELSRRQAELERSNAEMRLLNELSDLLQGCQNAAEAYDVAAGVSTRLFPARSGALSTIRASRDVVEVRVWWGAVEGLTAFSPVDCWALRRGQAHLSGPDAPRCPHLADVVAAWALCVPMSAQGQITGVFHLLSEDDPQDLDGPLRQLALTAAAQISLAVANLELRDMLRSLSIRDPLTGLYNRRFLEESLSRELSRAERDGTPVALLQLDIDHFKAVNDEFGHDAGDAVLKALAAAMRAVFRDSDVVCRFGGEEFSVLLPATTAEQALMRAEELRARLAQLRVPWGGRMLQAPSISGGLAMHPVDAQTADELQHLADQALYAAKQAGRDRILRTD